MTDSIMTDSIVYWNASKPPYVRVGGVKRQPCWLQRLTDQQRMIMAIRLSEAAAKGKDTVYLYGLIIKIDLRTYKPRGKETTYKELLDLLISCS